jgi:Lysine-specific metallo-endopeptidase
MSMSFEYARDTGKSSASGASSESAASPGKHTLTGTLASTSESASSSASTGKAEYGGSEVRASIGNLAEGSHVGVKRGGGGKRRIGNINAGTFVPDPTQAGAASAAPAAAPGAAPASPTAATGHDSDRAYVGSTSSHVADRTTSDGTTSVRMEDENNAQAAMIAAAVTRAREILDNAIGKISNPSDPKVSGALQANFHSTEAKVSTEVSTKLSRIRNAFNGTIPVEVESDGTARAYVYVIWSDIHLCPPWFADTNPDARARTIIHECSHKYTGTDDKAYHWDPKYASISTKDALNNADSYAWFCMDVL